MKILIIIPAYNEQKSIARVVNELKENYPNYDCIVLNDCSKDNTELVCRENDIQYLSQPINLGIGGNVQTGFLYAKQNEYDIAIQYDGDGQHDWRYLPRIIEPIANQTADLVIGSRFISKQGFQTTFMRRTGIRFFRVLIHFCCKKNITDSTSGFRACSSEMIEFFSRQYAQDYPEPEAVVNAIRNGFKVMEVPVIMNERKEGVSSINMLKSVYYMIKVSLAIVLDTCKPVQRMRG